MDALLGRLMHRITSSLIECESQLKLASTELVFEEMEVISVTHSLAAETLNLTCTLSKCLNPFEQLSISFSFTRHSQGHHPINSWLFPIYRVFLGLPFSIFVDLDNNPTNISDQTRLQLLSLNCGCLNCVTFPTQLQKSTFDKPRILIWGNTKPLARQRSAWKMMTDTFDDISQATCLQHAVLTCGIIIIWKRQS